LLKTSTPSGDLSILTYDGLGRVSTTKDARGLVLTLLYNDFGKAYKVVWADNTFIEETYNDKGQTTSFRDRLGNTSSYEYDSFGRMTAKVLPNSLRSQVSYDTLSRIISKTLNNGSSLLTTSYTLDFEDNVTSVALPDATSQSYIYSNGLLSSKTDHAGKIWSYTYFFDRTLKSVSAPDGIGNLFDSEINDNGQISRITEADNVVSSLEYDSLDRIIRTTMPDGSFYQTGYAAAGANSIQDRSGRTTGITYDSYGRRTTVTDPNSASAAFAYNPAGDMIGLTDANTNQTGWAYDNEGRATAKTYADSSTYAYQYNANGQLVSRKDAKNANTSYSYDNIGNLTNINYPNDPDISFTYDSFGRRTGMTDVVGSTTWTYDPFGRLASTSLTTDNGSPTSVVYAYDSAGRRASMSAAGQTILYSYDSLGRLSSLRSPSANSGEDTFTYSYVGASSKIASISLNGNVIVSNTYDTLGRLIKKENFKPDGTLVSSFEYTLNASDERIDVKSRSALQPDQPENLSISYSYDLAGQLTGAVRKFTDASTDYSYNYGFNYDPAGNPLLRTSQGQSRNYTFNNLNQFLSASGPNSTDITGSVSPIVVEPTVKVNGESAAVDTQGRWVKQAVPLTVGENTLTVEAIDKFDRQASETRKITLASPPVFTYDANGNMTGDGLWQYSWNDENRMTVASFASSAVKVENVYDGMGRRRIKKVFQLITDNWSLITETKFIYDGVRIIAELNGNNEIVKRFVWNGDQLLAVEDIALGQTFYYCTDGNKNITELVDSEGNIAAHYEYSPFGKIVKESGSYAASNPFRFSSEYFDRETGLIAYLFRDYSPEYSKWLSRDPIEEAGGTNLYQFLSNNSINWIDILGLEQAGGDYITVNPDAKTNPFRHNTSGLYGAKSEYLEQAGKLPKSTGKIPMNPYLKIGVDTAISASAEKI
ncbi:MAG: RHS repeat-associated core domain-containing protein, partial [Rectinemataceae bacterium]|nr:RHS repeat-associated core domain-containing protein [Rectinemataceae bacterium]